MERLISFSLQVLYLASYISEHIISLFSLHTRVFLGHCLGLFPGKKPVFVESVDVQDLIRLLGLIRGFQPSDEKVTFQFGAQHAILVLDEASKKRIPEVLKGSAGKRNLILTIYESKGLEFDHVLLYNFFTGSKSAANWRVLTWYLDAVIEAQRNKEQRGEGAAQGRPFSFKLQRDKDAPKVQMHMLSPNRPRPLEFDAHKHKLLASELKQLYTAVTRARDRVWLFDESADLRAPMLEYLRALDLVTQVESTASTEQLTAFIEEYTVTECATSRFEWRQRADEFYRRKLFDQAACCYENAGDETMRAICAINIDLQTLNNNRHTMASEKLFEEKMLGIVERYLRLHHISQALRCLSSIKAYSLMAAIFQTLHMVFFLLIISYCLFTISRGKIFQKYR